MSMAICTECGCMVDTDDDPACFIYVGNYKRWHDERVVCESCRDDMGWSQERDDALRAKHEEIYHKVEAAMKEKE